MKIRIRPTITNLIVMLILLTVLFFGLYPYFAHATSSDSASLKHVNLALNWIHQSGFAGTYVALEKGYYHDSGLNVSLVPYSYDISSIDLVARGYAEFGVTTASEIAVARSKGIPVRVVAVIYQFSPVCAYSLKSSGIKSPKDFIGKRIGVERGINVEYEYIAMMDFLHINRSNLTEIDIGYEAEELLNGTIDVSTGYVTNEPYYVISKGLNVNIIMVEDYGVNVYADVLFATDDMINTNPELVRNFVQATLKGWQYTIEHEDEALNKTMPYIENKDIAHERYTLHTSLPLISTGDVPIGYMNEDGWRNVQKALQLQKIPLNNSIISDCYTTQFITYR